jgi:hypothetical protein
MTVPDRRRNAGAIEPGGRRALVLTLQQVADVLSVDVRTVRKLIRLQREEDAEAKSEGRSPRTIGLRAVRLTERLTRVTEQALGEYLASCLTVSRSQRRSSP